MQYLIDGHNLIGQMPDLSYEHAHDEAVLVQKLNGFVAAVPKARCVVIFDRGNPGGSSRMSTSKVDVIFAPHGSNADHLLIRRIQNVRTPDEWTLVSSDNVVRAMAKRRKMRLMGSADFVALMRQPPMKQKPRYRSLATDPRPKIPPGHVDDMLRLFEQRNPDDSQDD